MTIPAVHLTWAIADECKDAPLVRVVEKPIASDLQHVAAELTLNALPWRLTRMTSEAGEEAVHCELSLEFGEASPLQCKMLQLQLASSARHIELHVKGVRRNMLGEEERSEMYFGTYRGSRASDELMFTVAEEFQQANRDHDVLKCIHSIRIKFVSLAGDKNTLNLSKFQCLYIARPSHPILPAQAAAVDAPTGAADVMGVMSGMSLGNMNPQMILAMVQQMMEREIETKIARALDAKLAVLSQRLSFSEHMLLQVQQKSTAKDTQVEKKLDILQQQLSELRSQLTVKEPSPDSE